MEKKFQNRNAQGIWPAGAQNPLHAIELLAVRADSWLVKFRSI